MWPKSLSRVLVRSISSHVGNHHVQSFPITVTRYSSTNVAQDKMRLLRQDDQSSKSNSPRLDPFVDVQEYQMAFLDQLRPPAKRSFNLAAYVNDSRVLQELIKLGVSLYDIEQTNCAAAKRLVLLDFERDCMPYIHFLVGNGLQKSNLGRFISEFPSVFQEHLDDLQTRINYYESKGFSKKMIATALNKSSRLIVHETKYIDHKLGRLQVTFCLPAPVVRRIVTNHPEVISLPPEQYELIKFCLDEEFGFRTREIEKILAEQPQILDILRPVLIERLELIHNTIGFSHNTISEFPELITGPRLDIKYRAAYLSKLKRDQYDPKLPLYVPPYALFRFSDKKFCTKYAKASLGDYKLFIKDL